MTKRLKRSDYILSLVFIFLLICCIAAFFYGLKIGKEKTEMKYEHLLQQEKEIPVELTAYHQHYIVSYYHTIFLPYLDFQKSWFQYLESIQLRGSTTDVSSVFKELKKLANEQYNSMTNKTMPETSPLLQQAHEDTLKSLKLFTEAIDQVDYKKLSGNELIAEIDDDVYFQEAKRYGLSAQSKFYTSILLWHRSFNPNMTNDEVLNTNPMDFTQWEQLNLNEKNRIIASYMLDSLYYEPYYVHDLTIRIDEMLASNQLVKMNLQHVDDVVETLIHTRAVRPGDYISLKDRFYQDEMLPQLPFFFE